MNTLDRSYRVDFIPRVANCPLKIKVQDDIEQTEAIILYPNPANTTVNISSVEGISSIYISNVLGQNVYSQASLKTKKLEINISFLPKGIYYVRVETKNKIQTLKLIKE